MTIIITKANAEFIRELLEVKKLKVVNETANTLHVQLSTSKFVHLKDAVELAGLNPYAVMAW